MSIGREFAHPSFSYAQIQERIGRSETMRMEQKQLNSGVYKIVNIINNKLYIGSSAYLRFRKSAHFSDLRKNKHHSQYLQEEYDKYGRENFVFEVIEYIEDKNKLIEREQYWMDYYKSYEGDRGYNMSPTAGNSTGVKFSQKSKAKLSMIRKGRKISQETRQKMSESRKGIKNHNYGLKGINSPLYKRVFSEETLKKMSLSHIGLQVGDRNGNYGKNFSEAHREKISKARKKSGLSRGENNSKAKLKERDVIEIKYLLSLNAKISEIANKYNVHISTINDIKFNRRWQFINLEEFIDINSNLKMLYKVGE